MKGHKVAVAVLATILILMVGALLSVLAKKHSGDSKTAAAPVITKPAPDYYDNASCSGSPAYSSTGTNAE